MKKTLILLIILTLFSCDKKINSSIHVFEINYQEFFQLKEVMLEKFSDIKISDKCYKHGNTIHITLKYLENCFSNLDKSTFVIIHSFISKYSIVSISLEKEKITLLMKVDSDIFNTKKEFIIFSEKKVLNRKGKDSINYKFKQLKKNWYYTSEKETTF